MRTVRLLVTAAITNAVIAAVCLAWLIEPSWNKFVADPSPLLRVWLSPGQLAAVGLALGLVGLVTTAVALSRRRGDPAADRTSWPGWVTVLGVTQAVALVLGLCGVTAIRSAGYAMALAFPVAALVVLTLVVWRSAARWFALALAAVVIGAAVVFGALSPGTVGTIAALSSGLPRALVVDNGMPLLLVTAGAARIVAAAQGNTSPRVAAWVLRHRTAITVIAALGPAPYALIRVTLLTPWPQGMPEGSPAHLRLFGMMLGAGAWVGIVLTLGLIRPWGETFPRWLPVVAGRPVPLWFAVIPGGLVAAIVTASAIPAVRNAAAGAAGVGDILESMVVFPFWLWGPTLALAVWGYVLHRSQHVPVVPRVSGLAGAA